jgi:large subunit ribosomal protein L3
MALGLLGKKLGMTHVYDEFGRRRAVTAVQAGPCTILALREAKPHGYRAIQVGFEPVKEKRVNKARLGQFKKAGTGPFRHVREFRLADDAEGEFAIGQQLTSDVFQQFEIVDVTGISIGKGFQGGMKRWHWKGGRASHGSMQHRKPGSIGSTTTPGRVIKGHHLPGHMGNDRVTVQNLRIARIYPEQHLLLIEGSIPGAEQQLVFIRKAQKNPGVIRKPQAFTAVIEDDENLSKTAKAASKKPKTPSPAAK